MMFLHSLQEQKQHEFLIDSSSSSWQPCTSKIHSPCPFTVVILLLGSLGSSSTVLYVLADGCEDQGLSERVVVGFCFKMKN